MKNILFLLAFMPGALCAQYSILNFWGPYAPENWETFGEVEMGDDYLILSATLVETQGGGDGGDGFPEEETLSEASITLEHSGTLFLDYYWFIGAPDCLERKMLVNGTPIVLSFAMETNGIPVYSGDLITFQIVWYPDEMDCGSGSWDFGINDFRIELSDLPCPNASPTPDLDGDGWVGITDLMLFLTAFGTTVE